MAGQPAAAAAPVAPNRLVAACEGLLAFIVLVFTSNAVLAAVRDHLKGWAWENEAVGAIRAAAIIGIFSMMYSRRFAGGKPAALDLLKSAANRLSASLPASAVALIGFHALQALALVTLTTGGSVTAAAGALLSPTRELTACATTTGLIWAPLLEEVLFRYIVFYVVAQRSGGQLTFGVVTTACMFGALHVGNLVANFSPATAVQVVVAALVGVTLSLLYATTGSLLAVTAVHMANNSVGSLWQSMTAPPAMIGSGVDCSAPVEVGPTLAVSLLVQILAYAVAGLREHRRMMDMAALAAVAAAPPPPPPPPPPAAAGGAQVAAIADAAGSAAGAAAAASAAIKAAAVAAHRRLQAVHPLLYEDGVGVAGAAAQPAPPVAQLPAAAAPPPAAVAPGEAGLTRRKR